MIPSDTGFNLFFEMVLSPEQCEQIVSELRSAPQTSATVYGQAESGLVNDRIRKARIVTASSQTTAEIKQQLHRLAEIIGEHFGIELTTCEEPQFLRYSSGDFFVAHQDGNTGLLRSEREQSRKVSVVIFLNNQSRGGEPGTYNGGSLVFSDWHPARPNKEFALSGQAGMLVAFPAETTHEVRTVTSGERYSIVSWYG